MKRACFLLICIFFLRAGLILAVDEPKPSVGSPENTSSVDQSFKSTGSRDIVFDNGMSVYHGLAASQYDNAINLDPLTADDFVFWEDTEVSDVHWIGGYWDGPPDDGNFGWAIIFYEDSGGLGLAPGNEIEAYSIPNMFVNETWISGSPGGTNYYSYSFDLPDTFFFSANTTYWIAIQGVGDYPPQSGWAYDSSDGHLHESVFYSLYFGYNTWTKTSEVFGYPLKLCFQLTGSAVEYLDWGDAPDSYSTLSASNGAVHTIDTNYYLGSYIDHENDGQPGPTALDDDNNDFYDDEDGVIIIDPIVPGSWGHVKVIASTVGYLNSFIDWNADGDWDEPDEASTTWTVNPGVNIFYFSIPNDAVSGITYSRWRYSQLGGLSFDGPASNGEVEDCRVFIQEPLENVKWYQPPDLDNTGMDVDMHPIGDTLFDGLADDFLCIQSGPITDIHIWASFEGDIVPEFGSQDFFIGIYSDNPNSGSPPWSTPDSLLWCAFATHSNDYTVTQVTDNNPEDYYLAHLDWYLDDNHLNCYRFDFHIPEPVVFIQDSGTIYWLRIFDLSWDGSYRMGWKTTTPENGWNDAAVYLGAPHTWIPIHYPPGHEFYVDSNLDLAFAITTEANCDCEPGEVNADGTINIFDITDLISYLYLDDDPPTPYEICSGDMNCDCVVNIFDITGLISYLYLDEDPPCTCEEWITACGSPLRK